MPYIKQDKRHSMDCIVSNMMESGVQVNGDLNYILFKFAKLHFLHGPGYNYNAIKNYLGELNECAEEIRRRFLVPIEDSKIIENGDI